MPAKRTEPKAPPPDHIPQLMTRVLAGLNSFGGRDLAALGLNTQSARTLVTLLEHGPMRVSLLADLVGLEPTGLSHLMRMLDQRGLMERERDDADHRAVIARLTTPGRALARKCSDIQARHEAALLQDLSKDETDRLRHALNKLIGTLAEVE